MNDFQILSKQIIAQNTKRIDVAAPLIAQGARPGQFVLVRADQHAEPLAVPIVETNPQRNSIALIFKEEKPSEKKMGSLPIGASLYAITGPLGNPVLSDEAGSIVFIGYELGIAQILSISRYFHKRGNRNFGIIGAVTKRSLILEPQMRLCCQSLSVTTEDGSFGKKGFVGDILQDVLAQYPITQIFVAAPPAVIQEVIAIAKQKKAKIYAVLPPVALSGIGFCGTDEMKVGQSYVCLSTEGPIVDAQELDFKTYDLKSRKDNG